MPMRVSACVLPVLPKTPDFSYTDILIFVFSKLFCTDRLYKAEQVEQRKLINKSFYKSKIYNLKMSDKGGEPPSDRVEQI
jgi:hypothetical protein